MNFRYIYTKKIEIEDVDDANYIFYAARKYEVIDLEYRCMSYIKSQLTPENACKAYDLAELFDDEDLKKSALKIFSNKTNEVLSSNDFLYTSIETINAILEQDKLNVKSELCLFEAIEKYALASNCTDLVRKKAVKNIQFLKMTQSEFARGPIQSNILLNEEKLQIASYFLSGCDTSKFQMPEGFTTETRRQTYERTNANIVVKLEFIRACLNPPFFTCCDYKEASIQHIIMKCSDYSETRSEMVQKLYDNGVFRGHNKLYDTLQAILEANDEVSLEVFCNYIRYHNIDVDFLLSFNECEYS